MIRIDNRIGSKNLAKHLPKNSYTLTRLQFGDFAWIGKRNGSPVTVGVERKTISDFINSFHSGRLAGHQTIGMHNTYQYPYLLVEGQWTVLANGTFKGKSLGGRTYRAREILGFMNSISVEAGLHLVITFNVWHTAQWLYCTHQWWNKDKHRTMNTFYTDPPTRMNFRKPPFTQRALKEIPGIGWDKAEALMEKFHTVDEVCNAEEKDLISVKGISKGLAQNILTALHERSK